MPSGKQPSVRLRRIGSALRKAREDKRMTMDTASRLYGRSKGWLSTLENGLHAVSPEELSDLLDFYDVPEGPLRESLLHLAKHQSKENWQREREGRISAAALDLASLEEDTALIRTFQPCVIPGLLQVPDYTRALITAGPSRLAANVEELVAFRTGRQRILTRPDPPHYLAIISELALHNPVAGSGVMRAQINRLADVGDQDNIELRILPVSAGACLWLAGPFDLLLLRPPGRLTVSVSEHFARSLFVENEGEVAYHESIFAHLLAASLDESSSRERIGRLASVA